MSIARVYSVIFCHNLLQAILLNVFCKQYLKIIILGKLFYISIPSVHSLLGRCHFVLSSLPCLRIPEHTYSSAEDNQSDKLIIFSRSHAQKRSKQPSDTVVQQGHNIVLLLLPTALASLALPEWENKNNLFKRDMFLRF